MKLLLLGGTGGCETKIKKRTTLETITYFNSNHPNITNKLVESVIIKKYKVATLEHTEQ